MCVVLTFLFAALAYSFYSEGNIAAFVVNGSIAFGFLLLLIRNILKTKKEREEKKL